LWVEMHHNEMHRKLDPPAGDHPTAARAAPAAKTPWLDLRI